jgi:hypothetical protein
MQPQEPQYSQYPQQPQYMYVQQPNQPTSPQKGWFRRQGCLVKSGIVIGALILLGVVASALDKGSTSTGGSPTATTQPSGPTATSTPKPKPTVLLDMSGNGTKTSPSFTVHNANQTLKWTCDPNSFQGIAFNVIATVYNAGDKSIDSVPVNSICGTGSGNSTGDTTSLHLNPGSYYISMDSEGSWRIIVTDIP